MCISGFYSVPLIHISLYQYHTFLTSSVFVALSEVWEGYNPDFFLFPQDCYGNSGSFWFHINFRICSSSVKNVMGNLIVQFSRSIVSDSLQPHGMQQARLPCPSPTPRFYSNSSPLSWWCHPTISSSAVPFSCLQSFPASGSFQISQFFASGGQSIGVSASVLPMNIQDWFPLGLTGWISLQSKGLFKSLLQHHSSKHQFFGTLTTLASIRNYWKNHSFD